MALTAERKAQLAQMDIPGDRETIARATAFQQRAGLTTHEFSQLIGYSTSTLSVYLGGHYGLNLTDDHDPTHNTLAIRAALTEYMDKWDDAQPEERRQPHRTADFSHIFECCLQALEHGTAYVIDGPPGTQKTYSLRAVEREIKERIGRGRVIYVYARDDHKPLSFLREICNSAGISNRGDTDQVLRKLRFYLGKERILLMVDEAQHLPHKTLEVLRQLLDLPPYFGIVLAGSHDLADTLNHWQMEQWRSRLRKQIDLTGPTEDEAIDIFRAELEPLVGKLSRDHCRVHVARCMAEAQRTDRSDPRKPVPRRFKYISARLLFFSIEDIRRSLPQPVAPAKPAQKESAA